VPIPIYDIAVGRSHAIAVLDNAVEQHDARFGRDGSSHSRRFTDRAVFVWGHNERYQLGTGKRTNLNAPQHLKPLRACTRSRPC